MHDNICIFIDNASHQNSCYAQAEALSRLFKLPFIVHKADISAFTLCLNISKEIVSLLFPKERMNPLYVDYNQGKIAYRCRQSVGFNQAIAKAVGLSEKKSLHLCDATAGMGSDAFVLAYLGAYVSAIERHPLVLCLLVDGIRRGLQNSAIFEIINRFKLYGGSAQRWLVKKGCLKDVDVVYLDPMFPIHQTSAQVKKEMQVLRRYVGLDDDQEELLDLALRLARYRVVVKRPLLAPFMVNKLPTFQIKNKNHRFDIYVNRSLKK